MWLWGHPSVSLQMQTGTVLNIASNVWEFTSNTITKNPIFRTKPTVAKKKHGFTLRWNQAHVWCLYSVLCLKGQLHAKCMCIITITETVHFRGQLIVLMTPIPQCNVYWVSDQTVSVLQCYRTRVSYKGFSITSEDSDKYN